MKRKLIIDGNAVYEIDDECARYKEEQERSCAQQIDTIRRPAGNSEKEERQRIEDIGIL